MEYLPFTLENLQNVTVITFSRHAKTLDFSIGIERMNTEVIGNDDKVGGFNSSSAAFVAKILEQVTGKKFIRQTTNNYICWVRKDVKW